MFGHSVRLKNTTLIRIWVQTDPAAEGSGVDRHCPYNPWKCYHSRIWKQSLVGYFRNTILKLRQIQKQEDHLPVDSAESVHSRTAESSNFTVITNTDLLATWIKFDPFWFKIWLIFQNQVVNCVIIIKYIKWSFALTLYCWRDFLKLNFGNGILPLS